jgi:hypothetical protein
MSPESQGQKHGTQRWQGVHATLALERPAPGIFVLRITGHDVGEFGDAPLRVLERHLAEAGAIELFIDARHTEGATMEVSGRWAQWLAVHRAGCTRICMLTGSRLTEITAEFVRRFAGLGAIMETYTDAAAFDRTLAGAIAMARAPSTRH